MKRNQLVFLTVSIVVILAALCAWWRHREHQRFCRSRTPANYHCRGFYQIPVEKFIDPVKTTEDSIRVEYVCNQLILDPKGLGAYAEDLRKYLRCQGLHQERKCDCTDSLELWEVNKDHPDVNLIGVIADPPPPPPGTKGVGGELTMNYIIETDPTLVELTRPKGTSETISKGIIDQNQMPIDIQRVKIGVTDSGMDPTSPLMSNGYFLQPDPNNACGYQIWPFGQNMIDPSVEPNDQVGHGTFIGGILAGVANRTFLPNPPRRLSLLNIKVSDGHTGSLFDAVCGLYYGLNQGVRVFNVSWGYLADLDTVVVPKLLRSFMNDPRAKKSLIIAGMGNDGLKLDGNTQFWPACMAQYYPNIIAVGASDNNGHPALFNPGGSNISNIPNRMSLLAPGVDIFSLMPVSLQQETNPTGYGTGSGTSYATPFVTREVALNWMDNFPVNSIKTRLLDPANGKVTIIGPYTVLNN